MRKSDSRPDVDDEWDEQDEKGLEDAEENEVGPLGAVLGGSRPGLSARSDVYRRRTR